MAKSPKHPNPAKKSSLPTAKAPPEKHIVTTDAAPTIWNWLQSRGGLAIWRSIDPRNPGASWTTPFRNSDGTVATRPRPDADHTPERVISNPADVMVSIDIEVSRFSLDCVHDGSTSEAYEEGIRTAVIKAGEGAYYRLDKDAVVIYAQAKLIPIAEWISMTDEQRKQLQAECVEAAKKRHKEANEQASPRKRTKGGIVDATDEWLGRGIIITGVSKPKES